MPCRRDFAGNGENSQRIETEFRFALTYVRRGQTISRLSVVSCYVASGQLR
jgi:hypothetical protein